MRDTAAHLLEYANWALAIAATVLTATTAAVIVAAGYWTTHLASRTARRARHHFDLARMRRRPTPQPPATPQATDDYWTIRRAWHMATREEAGR